MKESSRIQNLRVLMCGHFLKECNSKVIMSSLSKVEMSYLRNAKLPVFRRRQRGKRGHAKGVRVTNKRGLKGVRSWDISFCSPVP